MTIDRSQRTALIGACFALSLLVVQAAVLRFAPWELAARITLPATIALVPFALWPYRRFLGVWVIFVGLAANLAPILANGGLMPIEHTTVVRAIGEERAAEYETGEWIAGSKDVLVAPGEGRLRALSDQIIIRIGHGGMAASPGDVVVGAGLLLLIAQASWEWNARRARPKASTTVRAQERARGGAAT
ncbi:MAG TPA: DUF5317 family protein [Dehalococcoidia bacterium]|nr:DUF5317 family protein [Dehalococcoidia bacterium]